MSMIEQQLEEWKRRLLDLGRRNPLLYFNQPRRTAVQITSPQINQLFDALLDGRKKLRFPEPTQASLLDLLAEEDEEKPAPRVRARPGDLETPLDVEDLQRKLNRLRTRARDSIEEQGINTLYLALGLLEWRESDSSQETVRSPLVLMPVGLKYERNKPFVLERLEEDVADNAALRFLFERDFHLALPVIESPEELTGELVLAYLAETERIVRDRGWRVLRESWLSIFSFESLVLYRDIADNPELYASHPILQWIAGDGTPDEPDVPDLSDLDSVAPPAELFPVLDADDSQLEVILRARAGQNLVVHGPPGTGKSQTIANLIAQSIRDGKTVLFVSRKMAALEVVFDRLKEVGLDDLCLELHSHRANKKDVVQRLHASLERGRLASPGELEQFERLKNLRERLNAYARALLRKMDKRDRRPYDMYGILAKLVEVPDVQASVSPRQAMDMSAEGEEALLDAMIKLKNVASVFDAPEQHPWHGAVPRHVDPQLIQRIRNALRELARSIEQLDAAWQSVGEVSGLPGPEARVDIPRAKALLRHLSSTPFVPAGLSQIAATRCAEVVDKLKDCCQRWREMDQARSRYRQTFTDRVLDLPIDELLGRYESSYRFPWRVLMPSYRRDSALLRSVAVADKPIPRNSARLALRACKEYVLKRTWLAEQADSLRDVLGPLVEQGADSDWEFARATAKWVLALEQMAGLERLPDQLATAAGDGHQAVRETAAQTLRTIVSTVPVLDQSFRVLRKVFPKGYRGEDLRSISFISLGDQTQTWLNSLDKLYEWAAYLRALDRCEELELLPFVSAARDQGIEAACLPDVLRKALASAWITEAHRRERVLAEFSAAEYDSLRDEFRALDTGLRRASARATLAAATAARPSTTDAVSSQSEVGILRRQALLKRRHRPLRKLFPAIRNLLPLLKPCLLMSPLSVASYLSPDTFRFDLVIFDEASQIPPEEAVGAIVRGQQVVIAGDPKQLPPTSFFRTVLEDDRDDDDWETPSMDSILEQCIPIFPESYLLWHYRSKYESLIAFSNHEFYEGRLITFPSPENAPVEGGVQFVRVDGVYDRAGSRTNRAEARRIAEMVAEHMRQRPELSLGIIAMSVQQQEAIEQELSRLRRDNPDLEEAFQEEGLGRFFVKNLERVQGDERDCIIISLGYGPDQRGVIYMQFGPLSGSGGQRRLNVAITRGKVQTTLVSSLLPHQLDPGRLTSGRTDVAVLQRYIQYVADGGRFPEPPATSKGEPESDFEEAVADRLRKEGLEVDPQVGASSFRIDLGVRHPDRPGRYILGVECDGATFHRTKSARARDRLRQDVLEKPGWKLFRIWSPDWVRDPDGVTARILERVEELRGEIGMPADIPDYKDQTPGEDAPAPAAGEDADRVENGTRPAENSAEEAGSMYEGSAEYIAYVPASRRPRTLFYADPPSKLAEIVREVVAVESPVHPSVVAERIADAYGLGRVGSIIQSRTSLAVSMAVRAGQIRRRDSFLWRTDNDTVIPRRPRPGDKPRRITEICVEEIAAAVECVLRQQIGLPHDELVRQTARLFGYERTGREIQKRISPVIAKLVETERLVSDGDRLTLAPSARVLRSETKDAGSHMTGAKTELVESRPGMDTPDQLVRRLRALGLEIVDRRPQQGMLWVVGGEEQAETLRELGFKFAPHGGRATKNRPAWWYSGRG